MKLKGRYDGQGQARCPSSCSGHNVAFPGEIYHTIFHLRTTRPVKRFFYEPGINKPAALLGIQHIKDGEGMRQKRVREKEGEEEKEEKKEALITIYSGRLFIYFQRHILLQEMQQRQMRPCRSVG